MTRTTFAFLLFMLPLIAGAQSFTHVHLRAPSAAEAAEWYRTLLGGVLRPSPPGMGAVGQAHGAIATMDDNGSAAPSRGGAIDHFGFAVPDVAATLERARVMGARVIGVPTPGVTTTAIAMIEDPWGTRIELLETPDFRGIQHAHFVTDDPEALTGWFLEVFGGDFDPERGGDALSAIRYDGIWVYISEPLADSFYSVDPVIALDYFGEVDRDEPGFGETEMDGIAPSRGRSLDHIGFAVDNLDELIGRLRATGYEPYEIRPSWPGQTTSLAFFEGAAGIHFEIAQLDGIEPSGQR